MAVSKVLRKRSRPYYKEPSLADIYVIDFKRAKQHTEEEDTNISTAIAKHAVWESSENCSPSHFSEPLEIHQELGNKIKKALNGSRKDSPVVRISVSFKQLAFNSDLEMLGTKKQKNRGVQHYKIKQYQDLDCLLGQNWHYRGLNSSGDFGYVILNTVDFYIYTAHTLTEYFPSPSFIPQKSKRHMGHILIFCFIRGDGTPSMFGKDKNIFLTSH